MELKGKKINFIGDSITEGIGTSCQEAIYLNVLKEKAELSVVRNYGISGTRFALQKGVQTGKDPGMEYVDRNSFCERFDNMDNDADIVVVFGGTNDYGHGDALLGEFSDRTPDTFYGACHYLFSGLIRKYLGKTIVIMTPLHRSNELLKNANYKLEDYATLKEYVDIIREVAEYYSLPVLDLYKNSGIQPEIEEIKAMYMPDGVHPSNEGHLVIAHQLEMFLKCL